MPTVRYDASERLRRLRRRLIRGGDANERQRHGGGDAKYGSRAFAGECRYGCDICRASGNGDAVRAADQSGWRSGARCLSERAGDEFTADRCLEVTDATGKKLFSGMQRKRWYHLNPTGQAPYKLKIGAPAAVQIQYHETCRSGAALSEIRFVAARLTLNAENRHRRSNRRVRRFSYA